MINVSAEFKELMKSRTDFRPYAEITLVDGAVWALNDTDFKIAGNSVNDGAASSGLPLGVVVGRTLKLSIQNAEEQFKDVTFLGAEIRLYFTFQLSETVERIELGTFTVISPEEYGETISVQAVDNAWKLDTPYTTTLQYPQTAGAVFRDICIRCSVLAESSDFLNNDFVIESAPDSGLTNREIIGYIAMIAGGNARFNRYGKLEILTYEFPAISIKEEENYDGGTFEGWTEGDILDGGDFTDWSSGDDADGGGFNPWGITGSGTGGDITVDEKTHVLSRWINLKPFTEDIVITGVQTTKTVTDAEGNETETPVMYGTDGYVLSVNNPLIAGKEEATLALIGDVLVGARIRNFEGDHIGYPLAEFMDKAVLVDRKGNAAPTVLTDINFNFFGITTMKNSAAPPLRLSSKYNSAAAQAIIAAKNLVAKEKTQRELAIEALNTALSNSSGLYLTEEKQSDGSIITYLHDKPSLAESQTVIKRTAAGIGISNNGGVTYEYGLFFTGDAVLNTLQAEGINANWINAGALTVTDKKGNVLFQADVGTGNVTIDGNAISITVNGKDTTIPGAFSLYVGKDENDQIVSMLNASANKINITGDRIAITSDNFKVTYDGEIESTAGTIAGFTISDTKLYSDGGYGIELNAGSGSITVGDLEITSQGNSLSHLGVGDSYVVIREGATYGMSFYSDGDIRFFPDVLFSGGVKFSEMPSFPDYIPVSDGGTGRGSFTKNAVLLGNDTGEFLNRATASGAFYATTGGGLPSFGTLPIAQGGTGATSAKAARNNLGIYGGSVSITPSTSGYVDSANITLNNAADFLIIPSALGNTGISLPCTAYVTGTNTFKIRVFKASSWSGGAWTFVWHAIKSS